MKGSKIDERGDLVGGNKVDKGRSTGISTNSNEETHIITRIHGTTQCCSVGTGCRRPFSSLTGDINGCSTVTFELNNYYIHLCDYVEIFLSVKEMKCFVTTPTHTLEDYNFASKEFTPPVNTHPNTPIPLGIQQHVYVAGQEGNDVVVDPLLD
jgi:hypothetical protein